MDSQRSQYRELVDAAPNAVFMAAPAIILVLDPKGRIVQINPYMERVSGYRAKEVIGRDWFGTFLPESDRPSIKKLFSSVMQSGINAGHVNPIVTKAGELRQVEWRARVLENADGTAVGLLNIGHDVTEHIAREAELQEAQELAQQADVTKTRFLAAASHDLRQPLQSLNLYLTALQRQLERPALLAIADKMRDSLDTMGELLNALLDISRLEGGSFEPVKADVRIRPILDRVVSDNAQQAAQKRLELAYAGEDCIVHTDAALLERVIENFVTNAIRYTAEGRVSITCDQRDGIARLAVSDTGVGIPPEALDRVFDEYCRLDNPMRDRSKGLGLGLAIVKRIAELLDHPVHVQSAPGAGSTFSIDVPVAVGASLHADADAGASPVAVARPSRTVLLVDNDPMIVDAATMLLAAEGFHVRSASNSEEALGQLSSGARPDVIVTDFRLSGGNGVELIRRAHATLGHELPSVLMTGDRSMREVMRSGLPNCTVLHKPVDADRLIALINGAAPAH